MCAFFTRNKVGWLVCACLLLFQAPLPAREVTRLLIESGDPQLQLELEKLVADQGLSGATKRGDLALALVIVTDPDKPLLAEINGHEMFYAASLPKIAILLGAAVAIEEDRLEMTDSLYQDLTDMSRYSCNECATRVLEQVGREQLLETLQSPDYRFYDPESVGGLWVGKDYGPGTAYRRDPLANLSHGATAFQAARFYYKLHTGTLVSPTQSAMMLETLSRPAISHKFVKGLSSFDELEIFRKSGTWKDFHADSALVRFDGHSYIMIALAHDQNGALWLEQLAGRMHELAIATSGGTAVAVD